MQAVILVGGEGRRLRPLTDTRPKPMMQLVDRPFVEHQLDLLRRAGVLDVVFSCGYRPEALEAYFGDGRRIGMRLRYVVDPEPLGTGGAIKNAEGALGDDLTLVLNGDILADTDIAGLVDRHRETGAAGTLTLTPVDDASRFGLVRLDADGRVEAFVEKPAPEDLRPGEPLLINAGTYLLDPAIFGSIPDGTPCSVERDIFPALAAEARLAGFASGAYWRDIGTPESYLQAHLDVLAGLLRTDSPAGPHYLGPACAVDETAWIGGGACLGTGVMVGGGAAVERSVVGAGTQIGAGAQVRGAIVGDRVIVGEGAYLGEGVVVGDRARIGPGVRLEGVTVATGEVVDR